MKSNLKMIAVAAAMASMVGAAQADIVTNSNNGSLVIGAFNTVTRDWYLRDTGLTLNQFLPSNVTTLPGDGAVTGNKTPAAGLVIDKTVVTNFGDTSFATWYGAQTASDVRWFVSANDNAGTSTSNNVKRFVASSANPAQTALNSNVDQYGATGNAGGLATFFGTPGPGTVSVTGLGTLIPASAAWDTNFSFGVAGLTTVGSSASLYYIARTTGTLSNGATITPNNFSNAAGAAVINLAANGDFTYTLAPEGVSAVPVPAAAWLLISGLTAMGGAARRRKGAAKA
jgi:hypothetical protein